MEEEKVSVTAGSGDYRWWWGKQRPKYGESNIEAIVFPRKLGACT